MTELLIGIACCVAMAGTLFGYLQIAKKKYYEGHDPSSLSATFYKTGWKFRVLLITLVLLLVYPVLLANGYYDGAWIYSAPTTLEAWGKFCFALCMGGIIGVSLNADFMKKEEWAHVVSAGPLAATAALLGCSFRSTWYFALAIWFSWLTFYVIKNQRNKKAGNPSARSLYLELVAFYSVPTCLILDMLLKYFRF